MPISKPVMAVLATDRERTYAETIVMVRDNPPGTGEIVAHPNGVFTLEDVTPANAGHIVAYGERLEGNVDPITCRLAIYDGTNWKLGAPSAN